MALQKTVNTSYGFIAEHAYHKIDNIRIFNKTSMTFNVKSLKSKDEKNAFDVSSFQCMYDIDGSNPIKQSYEYLKTLPEFAGAVDC